MKYNIYVYRDKKVSFGAPVLENNDVAAVRGFSFAVNAKDGIMNFKPDDFELYCVGSYDSDTGCIVSEDIPRFIVDGNNVKE